MNIIPQPKKINSGHKLNTKIYNESLICTNAGQNLVNYISSKIESGINCLKECRYYFIEIGNGEYKKDKYLEEVFKSQKEAYYLSLNSDKVFISSPSEQGLFYGFQTYIQLKEQQYDNEVEIIDWPDNTLRGFHLELRYGMPKFDRMLEIIDEIAKYKFNTLVIEYENRFPYSNYKNIIARHALSEEQLKILLAYAKARYLQVIPLQQTIGHLEYILKLEQYNHLKEVKEEKTNELPFSFNGVGFKHFNSIDEICATNEEAYSIIESLLKDIITKHSESRFIHIGCDEAWNLLSCSSCQMKYGEAGGKKLYIDHINRMAAIVKKESKVPIIWDDMLRGFDENDFEMLDKDIILMCWLYFEHDYDLGCKLISKFKKSGFKVIGASAAKCSEGINPLYLDMPYMDERLGNIQTWSRLAEEFNLEGVVTTLWSNYTGTIAPPHPFFDTAWYPVMYSAEKYWNSKAEKQEFYDRFIRSYFGVEPQHGALSNNNQTAFKFFNRVSEEAKRNKYLAQVYEAMSLLSAYRIKSLAINREVYKLFSNTTLEEKKLVNKRIGEVVSMRDYIKPRIIELLSKNYTAEDVEEFINSRFGLDELIYEHILNG
jgi:hexosaminidase